mmetsp:Transcript_16867/g.27709  ORF Transcript_16867/g.27709 Transcript_16867/m.27709 type:complete len:328 (-) Transcript_16867:2685-3668(-)
MLGHNRLRACLTASLAIIVAALLSSLPAVVSASQECLQIKEEYDLRNLARNDNVLLIVYDDESASVPEDICSNLSQHALTEKKIGPNGSATLFATLEVTAANQNFATTLNVGRLPSFLFISAGMDDASMYSDHITVYEQESGKIDPVAFSDFTRKHVGFSPLGNDVFTIIFFDSVASRFISYGNASGLNRLKQKGLALIVKIATLVGYKEPFKSIGKLYNRAFAMSLQHGVEYSSRHVARMENNLQSGNLTPGEYHELQQKIAILKSFSHPKVLTAEDDKKIYTHVALHIGLIVAALILIFLPAEGKSEEDEEPFDTPVVAKVVDDK